MESAWNWCNRIFCLFVVSPSVFMSESNVSRYTESINKKAFSFQNGRKYLDDILKRHIFADKICVFPQKMSIYDIQKKYLSQQTDREPRKWNGENSYWRTSLRKVIPVV